MNLFYLAKDFDENARYHVDKHVTKLQIESSQILCTALKLPHMRPTHQNHPCVKWAAARPENALWVAKYGQALNREYVFRYGKPEKYETARRVFAEVVDKFAGGDIVDFALAMPEEFRRTCPIESYRNYYRGAKQHLFSWKNREKPNWL